MHFVPHFCEYNSLSLKALWIIFFQNLNAPNSNYMWVQQGGNTYYTINQPIHLQKEQFGESIFFQKCTSELSF